MPRHELIGRRPETAVSRGDPSLDLIGRAPEVELMDALLDRVEGDGGALVLRGEAGIGKSALLEYASDRAAASGFRTLTTVGVESEAELAFAGLHQALHPVLPQLGRLPGPQRRALEAAFGITDGFEPDPLHVALAAHQLVCEAASSRPVLLIADDAHWLDRSTLSVLTFISRRLESNPVALLAAVREGYETPLNEARIPTRELERLSAAAAGELLDRNAPDLHPVTRARVLAEAAGNPLALVELSRVAPATNAAERISASPPTLTARLERAFATRLDELPQETRLGVLAAALDGRASVEEVLECATRLAGESLTPSALDPAVEAGMIDVVEGGLRFRHPLIRSAVRQAALPAQTLATYEVLADVVVDPERRLWHRAMSTVGFDEDLARALEEHADGARRRGAVMVAAMALERAADLTARPEEKGRWLVRAAELAYELGDVEAVRRLLGESKALELDSLAAARRAWLEQTISGDVWSESGATKAFVTIAKEMAAGSDADMALRGLVPIAHRAWWAPVRTRTRVYLVDTAESIGMPDDDPRVLAVVALAHPEAMGPVVRRRIASKRRHEVTDPVAAMHVGIAAEKSGDFPLAAPFLGRAIDGLREQGRLGLLTQALVHYAWAAIHTGDWEAARGADLEAADLARDSRQPQFGLTGQLIVGLVAGLRGNDEEVEELIAKPEHTLLAMGGGPLLAPAHLARGAAAIGDGRNGDAYEYLWPIFDESAPAFHRFMRWSGLLDLVEAGLMSGHRDAVATVIAELEGVAFRSHPPVLEVSLASARPLVASDEETEALFEAALTIEWRGYPFPRARTLFSLGRWLRRQRRSADSRVPLREAIALFDALGAMRWGERARQELRATGEKLGPRTPDARDRLTAQELQIAELAAAGLTNREIGERMFLSHRTIGSHLYRIFPKLDISSRAQLRDVLAAVGEDEETVV
jgi:DNA-binding CsgD family transcriptional regulator